MSNGEELFPALTDGVVGCIWPGRLPHVPCILHRVTFPFLLNSHHATWFTCHPSIQRTLPPSSSYPLQ